mgnify:CR=1 FL=1
MVTDILSNSILMSALEEPEAGNLVQIVVFLVKNHLQVILGNTIRVEQLNEILVRESLEWTTMILTWPRCGQVNCLIAVPGLVVVSLTFLTIRVANVVGVLFLEFFTIDVILLCELALPEPE